MPELTWKARDVLREFEKAGLRPGGTLPLVALAHRMLNGAAAVEGVEELRRLGYVTLLPEDVVELTEAGYEGIGVGGLLDLN